MLLVLLLRLLLELKKENEVLIRGKIIFKCTNCGHKFSAMDIEYMASVFSTPQICPKCKSIRTRPAGLVGLLSQNVYKKIWDSMEKGQRGK